MPSKPPYDVYCCYTNQDLSLIDHCISEIKSWEIDQRPINYFWDKESIDPSEDWKVALDRAIFSSKNFIIFLTPNWKQSEWQIYEIAQMINQRDKDSDNINIYPILFSKAKPSEILKSLRIHFKEVKQEKDEIAILRQVGIQMGVSISHKPPLNRDLYIAKNEQVFYETVSDKMVFSLDSVAKLKELVIVHDLEENISDLGEEAFYVLLDWLRYLRYIGSWKRAISIMEKAIDVNSLDEDSIARFWLEFEYFILRYEYRADFKSKLRKARLFDIPIRGFDKNDKKRIEIIVKKIFKLIQNNKFTGTFEGIWLRAIVSKALGNIYKELDKANIKTARRYCRYALQNTRIIEEEFPDSLSRNCFQILIYDCLRELANVEIYNKRYEKAIDLFDEALREILVLKNHATSENLMRNLLGLQFYFWGGFLVTCGHCPLLAINLLEESVKILESKGVPQNKVRIAANYALLGRLLPAFREKKHLKKIPYSKLGKRIRGFIEEMAGSSSALYDDKYTESQLFEVGKEYIEKARTICKDIGHTYTLMRTTKKILEIIIHEMISEKNDERAIHNLFVAQKIYNETINIGGFRLAPDFSSESIEERLSIIYELGLHSCSKLRYLHYNAIFENERVLDRFFLDLAKT